jgi:two-component system sensor histidine kinase UhpB
LTLLTQETLENVRVLAQQLRPSVLDDLGLLAALRWLAEDGRQRLHLDVTLGMDGLTGVHFPPACETAIFRIAQESLTNVARHAQATHVALILTYERQLVYLTIRDDGCGYDVEKQPPGLGIFGMNERASLLGGTLSITSQPGQGTTVQAQLPIVENWRTAFAQ